MREAKAYFEEATLATPPSQSDTTSPGDLQPTDRQTTPTSDDTLPGEAQSADNQTRSQSDTTSASDTSSSASRPPTASNSTSAATSSSNAPVQQSNQGSTSSAVDRCPQHALAAAHKATKQPGSSTALILQLREGSNTLKASNLVRAELDVRQHRQACSSSGKIVLQMWNARFHIAHDFQRLRHMCTLLHAACFTSSKS